MFQILKCELFYGIMYLNCLEGFAVSLPKGREKKNRGISSLLLYFTYSILCVSPVSSVLRQSGLKECFECPFKLLMKDFNR